MKKPIEKKILKTSLQKKPSKALLKSFKDYAERKNLTTHKDLESALASLKS